MCAKARSVALECSRQHGPHCPITNGLPFAPGQVPSGSVFALHDQNGNAQPVQTTVLGRWPDRSVRWLLVDTQSTGTRTEATWTLRWDKPKKNTAAVTPKAPARLSGKDCWVLKNDHVAVTLTTGRIAED